MTITLPDDLEEIVQRHMASGRYPAPADVLAAALGLLDADDLNASDAANAELRAAIAVGDADFAAGRFAPLDAATLARVRARRGN